MVRRWVAVLAIGVWVAVSLARLTRLVEPAEVPPGQEIVDTLPFLKGAIPEDSGYLYVLPGEFGTDSGTGPRLRYELYPRLYDDLRASADEHEVQEIMRRQQLDYIVVPDAGQYAPDHWLRQPRDWFRRIELDATRYVLEVR